MFYKSNITRGGQHFEINMHRMEIAITYLFCSIKTELCTSYTTPLPNTGTVSDLYAASAEDSAIFALNTKLLPSTPRQVTIFLPINKKVKKSPFYNMIKHIT